MSGKKKYMKRKAAPAVEWPTVMLIVACYAGWAVVGFFVWPSYPLLAIVALAVILALQSSLMHEASHGHPTRRNWLNELLVGLPIGIVYPFRRFKHLHLRHHADERLTDPFDDPESYYRTLWQHAELPATMKLLLRINNTMVGRFVIGPALASAGFLIADARLVVDCH
jgi:fatty acid desaturase